MLVLISPAKTLDFESPIGTKSYTQPMFLEDSRLLVEQLRKMTPYELSQLMAISDQLGALNYERFQRWQLPFTLANSRQALLAFKGDVYLGMQAQSFSAADFHFAQTHLRILSGLYGVLKPLDLIQPYRLEMGTRVGNERGKDLYSFWGSQITAAINKETSKAGRIIVNLASNEYFKSVHKRDLNSRIVTPVFKELNQGSYKVISFYAKKARGAMAAFIIKKRLRKIEDIKTFEGYGYAFRPNFSSDEQWVFARDKSEV